MYTVTNEENAGIIRFQKDGKRAYMVTNKGKENDLSRARALRSANGRDRVVESDPEKEVDFGDAMFSNETKELIGTTYEGDRTSNLLERQEVGERVQEAQERSEEGNR